MFVRCYSKRIILIAVGVLVVSNVHGVAYPLAVLPNSSAVDVNGSLTVVAIAVLHIKLKQLGAGCLCAGFI